MNENILQISIFVYLSFLMFYVLSEIINLCTNDIFKLSDIWKYICFLHLRVPDFSEESFTFFIVLLFLICVHLLRLKK